MALVTDKFVFVHIPKTGGTWFVSTINAISTQIDLKYVRASGSHTPHPVPEEELDGRPVGMCLRHPAAWLRSIWMHVKRSGGQADFGDMPLGKSLVQHARDSDNLRKFFIRVGQEGKVVSEIFYYYVSCYDRVYILRTEALRNHTLSFLDVCGLLPEENEKAEIVSDLVLCQPQQIGRFNGGIPRITVPMIERLHEADPEAFNLIVGEGRWNLLR